MRKRWLAAIGVLTLSACGRREAVHRTPLALTPLEDLSGGAGGWLGAGIAASLADQLASSARWTPQVAVSRSDAVAAGAAAVFGGYFTTHGDRLRIRAGIEDLASGRRQAISVEGRLSDWRAVLESLARGADPQADPPVTRSLAALRNYAEALFGAGPQVDEAYRRALEADPAFGPAYLRWAERLLGQGDRVGAARVLEQAAPHAARFRPLDRARLSVLVAMARDDPESGVRALRELVRMMPSDAGAQRALGRLELAQGALEEGASRYRRAAELEPNNPLAWNELGYAEAAARNLEAARNALEQYRRLAPQDPNPLDSLGDVHYYLGRFADAERFYREAYQRNPAFLAGATLYKAARARLALGDRTGADKTFEEYVATRRKAGDPLAELRQAQWEYWTADRKAAEARLAQRLPRLDSAEAAAFAATQMAAWRLAASDVASAARYAGQAAAQAQSAATRALARLCVFLAQPMSASGELEARAAQEFPTDARERLAAVAYGALLSRQFSKAAVALTELRRRTDPFAPEPLAVLQAWALLEAGQAEQACSLLGVYGFPPAGPEHPFAFLGFPRVFLLESACLARAGRETEARGRRQLFERLQAPGY
ncbi:MAG: tetratricopeptide repeat protein [Bryobacterales bacterium]|nr:tetratricopeptide repeat protein [Bryobacteraceae bacterium]MDW8353955.1 tetratricopeptide repeat protein [Bryobacterales bacterium]